MTDCARKRKRRGRSRGARNGSAHSLARSRPASMPTYTSRRRSSSRSHSIFTLSFKQTPKDKDSSVSPLLSSINLIDLAGSERAKSTGASGATLKEGSHINMSLTALGRCIKILAHNAALAEVRSSLALPFAPCAGSHASPPTLLEDDRRFPPHASLTRAAHA